MHTLKELIAQFSDHFNKEHFAAAPASLYDPARYFLTLGGKRLRPIMCLLGNELFNDIHIDAYHVGTAIELFHNFTLVHDDMMDKAPLRRGMTTIHEKYGSNVALLCGDVMGIKAYEYLTKIEPHYLGKIFTLFNKTAIEVCEGQQLDMDFETRDNVSMEEYVHMIALKTSVLIAAALQMGAIIGGASEGNQQRLYAFGKNLGIAFQIQDDYLDAFGDPEKFGKQAGGDIKSNKKTFLWLHMMEVANEAQKQTINSLLNDDSDAKVQQIQSIMKACNVDDWANELKEKYFEEAMQQLEAIAVLNNRKQQMKDLAHFLIQRDY
jgi:geranylgeranyl diphosphate synthase, type II